MAITKIQSDSLNLADDYTFTGTVAGARLAEADIKTLFNASGSAPVYACRAWVNFNGTGTPAIREDGNVTSITDNGTGDYTVNFTTAMPDANYAVGGSTLVNANSYKRVMTLKDIGGTNLTTTSVRVQTGHSSVGALENEDCLVVTVIIVR